MKYRIVQVTLAPTRHAVLDACHALSSNAYRPDWACTDPPHPARKELDRLLETGRFGIFVAYDEGNQLVGWLAVNEHNEIVNGNIIHGGLDGAGATIDPPSEEKLRALADGIRAMRGEVFHIAWSNPRMWYGLEITCGIDPSPRDERSKLLPEEPT